MHFVLLTDGRPLDLSDEVVYLGRPGSLLSQLSYVNLVGPRSYDALGDVQPGASLSIVLTADPDEVDKDGGHRVHLTEGIRYEGSAVVRSSQRFSQVGGATTVRVGPGATMVALQLELLDAPVSTERFNAARKELGLTDDELARVLHVPPVVAEGFRNGKPVPLDVAGRLQRLISDRHTAESHRRYAVAIRAMAVAPPERVDAVPFPGIPLPARMYIVTRAGTTVRAYQYLNGGGWYLVGEGPMGDMAERSVERKASEAAAEPE